MKRKGFTLIEVLVGIALISIIFFGVFTAYQLSLKIVQESKNRVTAAALANAKIEGIRNLSYGDIGVVGSYPEGILLATSTEIKSGLTFTVNTRVDYIADSKDGISDPADTCPNDYKRAKVEVSWDGLFGGDLVFSTDISPQTLAEECSEAGGILGISVFDAYGVLVPSPLIEVKDPDTGNVIKSATPIDGTHLFSLATSTYRVDVSKSGYSSERSYGITEVATPLKSNPIVLDKQLTETSFSIDLTGNLSVDTLSPLGGGSYVDSFLNLDNLSGSNSIELATSSIILEDLGTQYATSGDATSISVTPSNLYSWNDLAWNFNEPALTDIRVQLYYASGTDWTLIPDFNLAGNGVGFDSGSVDLSSLSTTTYPSLRAKGNLSTSNSSTTPSLNDWTLSWTTSEATAIGNIDFNLRGAKLLGTDGSEDPVYKFSNDYSTNSSGHLDLTDVEWDSYTVTIDPAEGLDIESITPGNPIDVSPAEFQNVEIYLTSDNSLMATIKDNDTLEDIFSAEVRLYGGGYDETNYTDNNGQTLFIPLDSGSYSLDISAPGYTPITTNISVGGDALEIFRLQRIE
jgi:prepilin-type N-terminal cleavage/methylation domain-containing protein